MEGGRQENRLIQEMRHGGYKLNQAVLLAVLFVPGQRRLSRFGRGKQARARIGSCGQTLQYRQRRYDAHAFAASYRRSGYIVRRHPGEYNYPLRARFSIFTQLKKLRI